MGAAFIRWRRRRSSTAWLPDRTGIERRERVAA
jgi:hypothetical protein